MADGGERRTPAEWSVLTGAGLGPLEAQVLATFWRRSSATVPEMVAAVRADGHLVAYTTVQTVVSRLHRRGLLDRVPEGRSHRYRPAISETEFLARASDAAVAGVLERFGSTALRQFALRIADLDPAVRQELIDVANAERDGTRSTDEDA